MPCFISSALDLFFFLSEIILYFRALLGGEAGLKNTFLFFFFFAIRSPVLGSLFLSQLWFVFLCLFLALGLLFWARFFLHSGALFCSACFRADLPALNLFVVVVVDYFYYLF